MLKQFGGGYADSVFADEGEAQQHSKLEKLYISTRAAKVRPTTTVSSQFVMLRPSYFLLTVWPFFHLHCSTSKGI